MVESGRRNSFGRPNGGALKPMAWWSPGVLAGRMVELGSREPTRIVVAGRMLKLGSRVHGEVRVPSGMCLAGQMVDLWSSAAWWSKGAQRDGDGWLNGGAQELAAWCSLGAQRNGFGRRMVDLESQEPSGTGLACQMVVKALVAYTGP